MSNQQNAITSFVALMKKLGVLVKVGDEVAKPCVHLAWQVLSAGMKILDLVPAMEDTYSFVISVNELKRERQTTRCY